MEYENIQVCLQQKLLLLTKVLDVSRQIEVRCKQQNTDLTQLLEERKTYIERARKCDTLMKNYANELESRVQERVLQILNAKMDENLCKEDELRLFDLVKSCNRLLRSAIAINRNAIRSIKKGRMDSIDNMKKTQRNGLHARSAYNA